MEVCDGVPDALRVTVPLGDWVKDGLCVNDADWLCVRVCDCVNEGVDEADGVPVALHVCVLVGDCVSDGLSVLELVWL